MWVTNNLAIELMKRNKALAVKLSEITQVQMELPANDSQILFSDSTSEEESLQSTEEVTGISISSPSYQHRSSSPTEMASEENSLQTNEEVTTVSISSPSYQHRSLSLRERPPKRTRMATHEAITPIETFTPNLRLPISVVYPELVQQNVTADTSEIIEL
jgi:hypothetical protein